MFLRKFTSWSFKAYFAHLLDNNPTASDQFKAKSYTENRDKDLRGD